jgi:hypothetical protein
MGSRYLAWKVSDADKSRTKIGSVRRRPADGVPPEMKVLPLRSEAEVVNPSASSLVLRMIQLYLLRRGSHDARPRWSFLTRGGVCTFEILCAYFAKKRKTEENHEEHCCLRFIVRVARRCMQRVANERAGHRHDGGSIRGDPCDDTVCRGLGAR